MRVPAPPLCYAMLWRSLNSFSRSMGTPCWRSSARSSSAACSLPGLTSSSSTQPTVGTGCSSCTARTASGALFSGLGSSHSVPHAAGCTYPTLRRLRLFREAGGADEMGDGDAQLAVPCECSLGRVERTLLEEYTWSMVHAFTESHKDCAKLLNAMQEGFNVGAEDAAVPFVEVTFSLLLLLPVPRQLPLFYTCLLLDLSKLFDSAPRLIERAVNALFGAHHSVA